MRLSKPETGITAGTVHPGNKLRLSNKLLLLLAAVLAVGAFLYYRHNQQAKQSSSTSPGVVNANDSIIEDYKNSSNIEDRRVTISAYQAKGDHNSALKVAKEVANSTKKYEDYMTLLTICGLNDVHGKESCINDAVTNLKPAISQMPFDTAYGGGGILEKNNRKNDAADFYQRAYDVYDATGGGDNLMSKSQLKKHIDELHQ